MILNTNNISKEGFVEKDDIITTPRNFDLPKYGYLNIDKEYCYYTEEGKYYPSHYAKKVGDINNDS